MKTKQLSPEQEAERMVKLIEPELMLKPTFELCLALVMRSLDEFTLDFLLGWQAKREVVESHVA